MKLIFSPAAILLFTTPLISAELREERQPIVVHEWGTFTSVATETGNPARWAPLSGPGDLPCFVARLGPPSFKDVASGLVRMETPVLYFYAKSPATVSVRVGFPEGWITEWYPNATRVSPESVGATPRRFSDGQIRWDNVQVMPGQNPHLPVTQGASHYFAARETDSSPIRIGDQWEKLIFYRGVADFSIPLRPVITSEGRVKITNAGPEGFGTVILFENREGRMGYRLTSNVKTTAELDFPELTGNIAELRDRLANVLVESGLYKKEADAMLETWSDSWFEEGMRLIYLVPREMVDRVLPLDVQPSPSAVARVFVGRVEMLSPGTHQRIDSLAAANDVKGLQQIGRFLGPFVMQMERTEAGRQRPAAIQSVFRSPRVSPGCVN